MVKNLIKKLTRYFGIPRISKPLIMTNSNISKDSFIGDYTYVGFNCNITKSNVGRYCSIANNVTIGAGEHVIDDISTSSLFYTDAYEILTKKKCVIQNDVWIGVNSVIRRGVLIGNGAIVGANSFVNKDVPAYAIVAGNPAKIIKYRFDIDFINLLIASNWWDNEIEEAKILIRKLNENKI
jgi:virginiamycin A acetyltransferase